MNTRQCDFVHFTLSCSTWSFKEGPSYIHDTADRAHSVFPCHCILILRNSNALIFSSSSLRYGTNNLNITLPSLEGVYMKRKCYGFVDRSSEVSHIHIGVKFT